MLDTLATWATGTFQQVGEERLDRVDRAVEVHVDDAPDGVVVEVGDPDERLDDAGHVDQPIRLAERARDLGRERVDSGPIGDVDLERRQPVPGAGELHGLGEARLPDVHGCDPGAAAEELEDHRAADPVPTRRAGTGRPRRPADRLPAACARPLCAPAGALAS
jgi:hypothetical protein